MNLLCPNCQKMLSVAERYAVQLMKCPLCETPYTVPALPTMPAASSALPITPTVSSPGPPSPPPPGSIPAEPPHVESEVFSLAPEPSLPSPPPQREEREVTRPALEKPPED